MIGILVCCCYKYYKQYEYISKKWNKIDDNNIKIFYLFGNEKIKNSYYDSKTNILLLKVNDNYESLPKKIYLAIRYILEKYPEINGIYKTDDDIVYQKIDILIKIIKYCYNNDINYSGLIIDNIDRDKISDRRIRKRFENKKINNIYHSDAIYCYGAGYYLSKTSMKIIKEHQIYIYKQYLEDVSIGHILNKYNIYPIRMNLKFKEIKRKK